MLHQEFEPSEPFKEVIKCFWYTSIDFGEVPCNFEILPDGYAEIVFHFGSACTISFNGTAQPLNSPCILGLLDEPVVLNSKNCLEILGIRCYPWTINKLFGLPSAKMAVQNFVHPIALLHSSLEEYLNDGKIEEAVAHLKQYFDTATPVSNVDRILLKAGAAMLQANGNMQVSQVATAANATLRTLERRFKQFSGYTVKKVSALMRFEQVRNRLWLYPNTNLASIAQEFGYVDQAHLSREFKRYSGSSPGAFARKHYAMGVYASAR